MRKLRARRRRGNRKEPKAVTLQKHARKRCRERVGVVLNSDAHDKLVQDIQQGRTTCVEKQSLRVSVHEIELAGQTVKVVYDRVRKVIITVLPLDA